MHERQLPVQTMELVLLPCTCQHIIMMLARGRASLSPQIVLAGAPPASTDIRTPCVIGSFLLRRYILFLPCTCRHSSVVLAHGRAPVVTSQSSLPVRSLRYTLGAAHTQHALDDCGAF